MWRWKWYVRVIRQTRSGRLTLQQYQFDTKRQAAAVRDWALEKFPGAVSAVRRMQVHA